MRMKTKLKTFLLNTEVFSPDASGSQIQSNDMRINNNDLDFRLNFFFFLRLWNVPSALKYTLALKLNIFDLRTYQM